MNDFDERINEKREALITAIYTKGITDKHTIQISQQLDVLIVEKMRNSNK
ncbi:aspartyl-phosphate phosphatase Spo0E family protein [Candidatus Bathyarchaeota archaeon]|nr:aspartyl-phosphate phosphatase Spo0E family protein [Candidatus Bathyarchaeota archaeon]